MLFAIVAFDESSETDFLPLKWIADRTPLCDISMIIKERTLVKFYWPPAKNPESVTRAKSRCVDAEVGWPTYMARILCTAGK